MVEDATAVAVVEALAGAWTVHNLYPDPEAQPAFHRIAESLRNAAGIEAIWLDVGPGFFLLDDREVEAQGEAAGRFAQRCFIHNIATIGLVDPPTDRDVAKFMGTLAMDRDEAVAEGGIHAMLLKDGVSSIAVVSRPPLTVAETEEQPERDASVVEVLHFVEDPKGLAEGIIEEAGGDPARVAELFHERFRAVYGAVDPGDIDAREEVVRVFVDAFFEFEDEYRVPSLELFLGAHDDELDRLFLDQFAGHELARIAPRLDSRGFALLLDYARIATDQTDHRPEELIRLLDAEDAGATGAVQAVAARVQERLEVAGAGEKAAPYPELTAQIPDPRRFFYTTLDTFRSLLAVEDRNDRFRRLMRLLTGKVASNIRQRRFRRAELWMHSVTDRPTFPTERAGEVAEALRSAASLDVMAVLLDEATASDGSPAARRLLEGLAVYNPGGVIGMLAGEQDRLRRRVLVEVAGDVARQDPAPFLSALDDERWFVTRNLAAVLRSSGRPEAVEALRRLVDHGDHRVRVEALRGLASLAPKGAVDALGAALQDEHGTVRRTAIGLLAVNESPAAEQHLIDALGSSMRTEEHEEVVRHLADRGGEDARRALEELAGKRFVLSARKRALRTVARQALGGMT